MLSDPGGCEQKLNFPNENPTIKTPPKQLDAYEISWHFMSATCWPHASRQAF